MIDSLSTTRTIEAAQRAYIECALWSSTTDDGDPLDSHYRADDIEAGSADEMRADVADFLNGCWDDDVDLSPIEPEQIGHDFWLTRNGHGAGFWDRGLGDLGDDLTKRAKVYGSSDLYVGDDGLLHAL